MIVNRQRAVRVAVGSLDAFLEQVMRELHQGGRELTVCLVPDAEMARLNRTFRGKKKATDVLSFPAASNGRKGKGRAAGARAFVSSASRYLGDIAIAPGVARRHARECGRSLERELQVLVLHGVLHLLGYDHETDEGEMERYERRLRRRLGLE